MKTILEKEFELFESYDGSKKLSLPLSDNLSVETCVLNLNYRNPEKVICISSQAGCPFKCDFCESGHRDFYRNLTAQEIVEQVDLALDIYGHCESFDVTYMGIGDPLANHKNVFLSIERLNSKYSGINKFNISTIAPLGSLKKFINSTLSQKIHLQISLHSPYDWQRKEIFRIRLPHINALVEDINNYTLKFKDTVCFNYLLFDGVNDSIQHAKDLSKIINSTDSYLKISTYNPISESDLKRSTNINTFITELETQDVEFKLFKSMGQDIQAGCGQLVSDKIC